MLVSRSHKGDALSPELDAKGNASHLWISAAILSSAPTPKRRDRAEWTYALGGPVHPVHQLITAATFPFSLPLALHVRVQGTGEAHLAVWVADDTGSVLSWGGDNSEPASRSVSLMPDDGWASEWATNLLLPDVRFPGPGQFTVVVGLSARPELDGDLATIRLPLEVTKRGQAAISQRQQLGLGLAKLLDELGEHLTPQGRRVLRFATAESRRLNSSIISTRHLLIALRRVLGRKSDLPPTAALRDATEQSLGLSFPPFGRRSMHLTPAAADLLRRAAARATGSIDADGLLQTLREDRRSSYELTVQEAQRLSSGPYDNRRRNSPAHRA